MAVVQNYAKWDAATKWANKRGMRFRVLNEGDIYQNTKKPKPVKPGSVNEYKDRGLYEPAQVATFSLHYYHWD